MDIYDFEWDRFTVEKIISKHNIFPEEVEQVFQGKTRVKSYGGIYIALGKSLSGRYLFVVFRKKKGQVIKIITAREMTKSEKRLYGRR